MHSIDNDIFVFQANVDKGEKHQQAQKFTITLIYYEYYTGLKAMNLFTACHKVCM